MQHGASIESKHAAVGLFEQLGDLQIALTNWAGAATNYSQGLKLAEGAENWASRRKIRMFFKKSFAIQSQSEFKQAEDVLMEVSSILDTLLHPPPDLVTNLATRLANLYEAWPNTNAAAIWRKKALDAASEMSQPSSAK